MDLEKEAQKLFSWNLHEGMLQVAAGTLAVDRLAHSERLSSEEREQLETVVEKSKWLIPRHCGVLAILSNPGGPLRKRFLENPNERVELLEQLIAITEKNYRKAKRTGHEAPPSWNFAAIQKEAETALWN
jgi:hypothetical protein